MDFTLCGRIGCNLWGRGLLPGIWHKKGVPIVQGIYQGFAEWVNIPAIPQPPHGCKWLVHWIRLHIQGQIQRELGRILLLLKISFSWEILDYFDKFTLNVHTLAVCLILLFNKSILLPVSVCKITEWVANSVDSDQTSDLGLHCLLRSVCPNTCT